MQKLYYKVMFLIAFYTTENDHILSHIMNSQWFVWSKVTKMHSTIK